MDFVYDVLDLLDGQSIPSRKCARELAGQRNDFVRELIFGVSGEVLERPLGVAAAGLLAGELLRGDGLDDDGRLEEEKVTSADPIRSDMGAYSRQSLCVLPRLGTLNDFPCIIVDGRPAWRNH